MVEPAGINRFDNRGYRGHGHSQPVYRPDRYRAFQIFKHFIQVE